MIHCIRGQVWLSLRRRLWLSWLRRLRLSWLRRHVNYLHLPYSFVSEAAIEQKKKDYPDRAHRFKPASREVKEKCIDDLGVRMATVVVLCAFGRWSSRILVRRCRRLTSSPSTRRT